MEDLYIFGIPVAHQKQRPFREALMKYLPGIQKDFYSLLGMDAGKEQNLSGCAIAIVPAGELAHIQRVGNHPYGSFHPSLPDVFRLLVRGGQHTSRIVQVPALVKCKRKFLFPCMEFQGPGFQ